MLPAGSQVTSVTWRKRPSSAGAGGFGCFTGPVSSSEASCLRPMTIATLPSGVNLMTRSDPLSVTQMLSSRSTRTACANDQPYRFLPISRTKRPSASNSSSCAAAAAYAGPRVLPREKTKMWPLELTATPETSPRYTSLGSLIASGTESKAICGTAWPNAGAPASATASTRPIEPILMMSPRCGIARIGAPASPMCRRGERGRRSGRAARRHAGFAGK